MTPMMAMHKVAAVRMSSSCRREQTSHMQEVVEVHMQEPVRIRPAGLASAASHAGSLILMRSRARLGQLLKF